MSRRPPALAVLIAMLTCGSLPAEEQAVDFRTQVAPILQQHCLRCHSPANREGDVSLATFGDLQANEYVVAGDPDGSQLIQLVSGAPGSPPAMPQEGQPLSGAEVATLRRWIAEGAAWPDDVVIRQRSKADQSWWSLQPLSIDPESDNLTIDDFIRARLAEHGLRLSPRADRRTLIRRLAFDLHGLPPSPESVQAFVADPDPRAYQQLVDRMLASPHYGERYARHWLDIAHYADTHGFERDRRRDHAWRYRDYVIESLNDDKPYPQFIQEQIAGDVLWPQHEQAVVATGFLAAGPWDFVGQVETKSPLLRRAARSLDLDDMATQVMTATMAMTVNCARCHDHKLDPISQREYYQLRAVFAGAKRSERVTSAEALAAYQTKQSQLQAQLNQIELEIAGWEGAGLNLADIVGGGNGLGTGTYRNGIDARTAKTQSRDFGSLGNVVTNQFKPAAFEFIDGVFIPNGKDGKAEIPITSSGITISGLPTTSGAAWDMIRNGPVASQHSPELGGIDFTTAGHSLLGLHANAGITFDLAAIRAKAFTRLADSPPVKSAPATPGLETQSGPARSSQSLLRFTAKLGYFGAVGDHQADAWVFVDGQPVKQFRQLQRRDGLQQIDVALPETAQFLTLISTDGGNGYGHDQIGFGDPYIKSAAPPKLTAAQSQRLKKLRAKRLAVSNELQLLGPPPKFFGVTADQPVPEVKVLSRGDPESPIGPALAPSALSALQMLEPQLAAADSDEGQRRLALARWITAPNNALTHRVIVNRLWHWHFGRGIVDTPSDFGFGGGRPSHPELLDWLATELLRRQGSLKAMHRLILNSATYQQQSQYEVDAEAIRIDAENRLLWRQNPRRIEAEAIRDAVLQVSGKLNLQRGGPGFEDFQYQDAYAPIYTYITADQPELWRRSIYRYIVRTSPNRFLTTLDCPDSANLTPRRLTTTTPLQSLALYNNEFMLKQARYFADRVATEAGDMAADQVRRVFELAFARAPSANESRLAEAFIQKRGLFELCRSMFNLNEFVYVD